jgi:hypothetical protein
MNEWEAADECARALNQHPHEVQKRIVGYLTTYVEGSKPPKQVGFAWPMKPTESSNQPESTKGGGL